MSASARRCGSVPWCSVAGLALLAAVSAAGAQDPPPQGLFDTIAGEILDTSLVDREGATFLLPPDHEPDGAAETGSRTRIAASGAVLFISELGASERFAGGGSGTELLLGVITPSGWDWSLAFSRADKELYSSVDRVPVAIDRYIFGVRRSRGVLRHLQLSQGVGVAWNTISFEGKESDLDVSGPGAYFELRLSTDLGKHLEIGVDGRLIYWRGTDGFGNSGDEMSAMLGIRVTTLF